MKNRKKNMFQNFIIKNLRSYSNFSFIKQNSQEKLSHLQRIVYLPFAKDNNSIIPLITHLGSNVKEMINCVDLNITTNVTDMTDDCLIYRPNVQCTEKIKNQKTKFYFLKVIEEINYDTSLPYKIGTTPSNVNYQISSLEYNHFDSQICSINKKRNDFLFVIIINSLLTAEIISSSFLIPPLIILSACPGVWSIIYYRARNIININKNHIIEEYQHKFAPITYKDFKLKQIESLFFKELAD